MLKRKRELLSFNYSSYKYEIEAQIDLKFLSQSTDYIRINGDDILDWLKDSTGGTSYLIIICRHSNVGSSVSVGLEFCNTKDALAYKLVFG
ncbi:hypothetical protein D3C87_1477330 [compost metagenome]